MLIHNLKNRGETMRSNIESERARIGFSKKQLCEHLNITGKTYLSYIRGGNIPSSKLIEMHEMFGCSIDYLLYDDGVDREVG